ncbi:MAG: protein serine/threonine phosphatase [Bacteroidetes bacterium]|nr:protein serine/threonine phosphatase [Bacteroidota bacterium]
MKQLPIKHRHIHFIIFYFLFVVTCAGQDRKTDSLLKLIRSSPHDSILSSCYDELSWDKLNTSTDSALSYANTSLSFAKKANNQNKIAIAYSTISSIYYYKSDMLLAINFGLKAYDIRKTFTDKTPAVKSLNNLAIMYEANGDPDKALGLLKDADKNLKANDFISSCIKNNMGGLYKKKGKYAEALQCYIEALRLKEKSSQSDKKDQAETLGNISSVYKEFHDLKKARLYLMKAYDLGMSTNDNFLKIQLIEQMGILCKKEKKYDEAISFYKEALRLKKLYGSSTMVSASLLNISSLLASTHKYGEALPYINEAIEIKRKQKDVSGLTIALNNYGTIISKLGKPKEGLDAVKEAMTLAAAQGDKENMVHCYQTMADIYEIMHDEKTSLLWIKKTMELKDSLLFSEGQKQIAEMETKYQTEKKEKEIALLNKDKVLQSNEIALKNTQRNAFIIGFVLMILLAAFVFRSLQQNKKKNKIITLQKKEVEHAKEIMQHQKELVDEKQKEILDSIHYAKRIQNALLTHQEFLNENLAENFVLFKPKDIVSGDFYWAASVHTNGEELFFLACCDSTGHGVPGAFMSLLNIGFLSEAIKEKNIFTPHEVFNYVRKRLIDSISKEEQKDGFDGILLCLNKTSGKITYAAANNNPLIISNHTIINLKADKMPVGKGEREQPFTLFEIDFKPGDNLYLFTDGYPDQFGGPKGKKFKYKPLENLLLECSSLLVSEQKEILLNNFEEWRGNLEQVDDVLIIGIKI